jgi:hypothetical protein
VIFLFEGEEQDEDEDEEVETKITGYGKICTKANHES